MARPTAQYCIVSIGYQRLLVPQAQALKLMEITSKALQCDHEYDTSKGRYLYRVGEPLEIEVTTVRAEQLIMPDAEIVPAKPKRPPQLRLN
ncbi:hypothetical protein RXE51_005963 [Pseudomonas aeruginosa]|nr:hypothetical protein [Pseudomonas aeruginosa]